MKKKDTAVVGKALLIASTVVCMFGGASAQNIQDTKNNSNSVVSLSSRVDPTSLGMNFTLQLGSYPGRGTTVPVALRYSSKVWNLRYVESYQYGSPPVDVSLLSPEYKHGWSTSIDQPRLEVPNLAYDEYGQLVDINDPDGWEYGDSYWQVGRIYIHMPGGGTHELLNDGTIHEMRYGHTNNPNIFTGDFYSVDSTGLRYNFTTHTLYMPDGSRYIDPNGVSGFTKFVDVHGNTTNLSVDDYTDTLGRDLNNPLFNAPSSAQNINYSLPGLGSGSLDYVLKWKELEDVLTASGELNYTGNCVNNSLSPALFHGDAQDGDVGCPYNRFNPILLNEIVLPDNTSYVFTYNVYGELDKIVYPTGAYERFAYDVVNGSSYVSNPYSQANRGVVDRWVSASGSPSDEVHSAFESSVGSTTITAPDGSYTVRTYQIAASGSSYGYEDKGAGSLLEEKAYDSNDNLLGRILFEYQLDGPYSRQFDPRVTHKLSIVFENGESSALATMSKVEYATPGSGGAPSDWSYFAKLNAVKTTNYNDLPVTLSTAQTGSLSTLKGLFNSSGEIAGINETDFLYDSNYNVRNIRGLTTESRVKDANGNIKARMQISYDESYYQTTTSGATPSAATGSWIDLTAAGELGPTIGAKRGRATSAKSYYDISNGYYIETHTFHDQFGNTTKSRDGLGTDVTISFDDDYAFAYPTSVTTPIPDSSGTYGSDAAFTNSTTYDYNTGRPLTSTDANGQTSTMEYADSLLRPTKVTAPNGQQTISEYGAGTNASTRWVRVRTQIDETRWKEAVSWFDALGRGIRSQNIDPESGDVFSLTCYS